MGQVTAPTYPTHGAVGWDTLIVSAIEAVRSGHNATDTTASNAATAAAGAASTAGAAGSQATSALAQALAALAAASVNVNTGSVSYDAVNHVWPNRPAVTGGLGWSSTNDKDAIRPPQMAVGDWWIRNPLATPLV